MTDNQILQQILSEVKDVKQSVTTLEQGQAEMKQSISTLEQGQAEMKQSI